ncbi:phage tail tape measure protein, partial [Deinococcus marmoris]|uniref:phage tail tape measure protein n=1 Tax=Deinococcus marmoris TaxID=249408 RepID=UPI00096A7E19
MTKGQSVGGLFIDTGLDLTGIERDLQKARQFVERTNGVKLNIDNRAAKTAIEQVKADLAALKGMSERDAQARAQAARLLGTAYKEQAGAIRGVTAELKTLSAQSVLTARLGAQADREAAAAVRALVTARKEAATLAGRAGNAADLARAQTALQGIMQTLGKLQNTGTVRLKFDLTSVNAELARLQGRSVLLKVSFSNFDAIKNDLTTLKGMLNGLGANMQYRVTVNTTALNAVYTQINTQITALQSLISQLRALGGGGGGGGGGGRGGPGISAANRALLAELEALNNQWKRGDVNAAQFGSQLTALQGRLRTASAGATAGTADFKALDAGLTRLTGSLRSINTDAFQRIRTEAGAMRAAFDTATAGVRRNSTEFRAASAVYAAESARITASLQTMARSGNLTTTQLGQVNREIQRLAREQNTIRGGINAGGLSGNIVNSFGMLPGQLGMMASQGGAAINAFQGIASAAGPAGLAVGGLALVVGGAALAATKAVNEYAKFEKGLAQIATLTDKTTAQLGDTGRAILKMSGDVGATYTDLNAGLYDVLGAGVKGTEDMTASLALLKQSAELARAGATETATATDVLTSVLNAYKLEASDATMVSDKLFKAVDDGKMSFSQLAQSLGMVLPTAKMAGLSLDEVLGSVAALTAQGIKPSSAIEYLRSALTNIIKPSMQAKETAKDLGIQFNAQALAAKGLVPFLRDVIEKTDGNSEAMARLFGDVGGLTAVTGLANGNFERLTATLEGQANAAGKTAEAYGKVAATISQKSDEVSAKWKSLWVNVGELFASTKTSVLDGINDMLTGLNDVLSKFNQARDLKNGVGKSDLLKQKEAKEEELATARSQLASAQSVADAQQRATGKVSEQFQPRLDAQKAKVAALEAAVADLSFQVQQEAQANGTFTGPLQTGGPAGVALTAAGADALGAKVVEAGAGKLGQVSADSIVNYCAQWVRLVLGKATPEVAGKINALFQTDSNGDGKTEATDAARNLLKAGFAQRYSGTKDLQKGDVVFYTENGQNHTGIYIGDGMVRGNNRVTYAANGGKFDKYGNPTSPGVNPVGDVAIGKLGTPNWIVRPGDMLPVLGAKVPEVRPDAGAGGAASAAPIKAFETYVKEARRILDQVEKYAPGGTAPNSAKWNKAKDALKSFGDQSDITARALEYAGLATKKADKATSQYGQTFDRLKGQLDITQSLGDLGRPSAEISKNLKAISTDALAAASAEKKRNGET